MNEQLQSQLMAIMKELSQAKVPALFIIGESEQIISVKNTNDKLTSNLILEYLNGSEERQLTFLDALEKQFPEKPNESTEQPATDGTTAE
ncbi:hypothetical protein [Chryseobacterium bernardetii]|uniref:hypothetical protein n=1 Tax=Chryseobacterium bernardetii TaxID=1241978 RepID=UPI003AF4D930